MANIFDYMDWRDLDLTQTPFNEVDNLILARLSYFPFDDIVKDEEITLKEAYQLYQKKGTVGRILQKEDIEFFPILAKSNRFGKIKLCHYINQLDPVQEKQFSAITIKLPDNTMYISYRGTDNTIIGWKEDFNMSFSQLVPAQTDATTYLENTVSSYSHCAQKIRVGGHSKGGNLAVYAATFSRPEIRERILQVYNNDGPGFHENVIQSKEYKTMLPLIHTFIPQSSIIGRLLEHKEKCTILKSSQTGIMQHDLYTWQVLGGSFVQDELTNSSEFIDKTITTWLQDVSAEQRGKFIDTFFEILNATQAKTLSELSNKKFETIKVVIKAYQNVDEDTKKMMIKTLNSLVSIAKSNIRIPKPTITHKKKTLPLKEAN